MLISCEENNGARKGVGEGHDDAGEGRVRERMVWGRGGGGKLRVREHSCLPAQVSSACACIRDHVL